MGTSVKMDPVPVKLYALHAGMEPAWAGGRPRYIGCEELRIRYRLPEANCLVWPDDVSREEGRVEGREWKTFIHLYPMPAGENTPKHYRLQRKFRTNLHWYVTGHKEVPHPKK